MGDRDRYRPDRPIFCGNFEYDARQDEIERLFDKFGPIERCDMKTGVALFRPWHTPGYLGFAFVYMKDKRDGEDAIRALDRTEFGYQRRRLCVQWARGDGAVKQREDSRRKNTKPTTTLFVVNFDPHNTRERDLERHFDRYGKLTRVQIKKNFAFIQYETVDMATEALTQAPSHKMSGRVLTVEYVAHEDNSWVARSGYSSGKGSDRDRSPPPKRRSRSPPPSNHGHSPRDDRRRSPPPRRRSPPPRYDSRSPPPRRSPTPPSRYPDSPPLRRGGPSRSRSPPPRNRSYSPRDRRGGSMSPDR